MIGSHNTFTYLPATKWYFRPFSFLWRCQNKDIHEQKELGVEYIDVRIRKVKNKGYRICHGLVDLGNMEFEDINSLMSFLECFNCKYRLIIERNVNNIVDIECLINYIKYHAKNCVYFGIKKPWTSIYVRKVYNINDYSYVPFYTGKNPGIKFKLSIIKNWAKKHNPVINNTLINDNIIHFMDYIGINKN